MPPLVTDIDLSMDDKFLYVACWGTGDLQQYDVSDPFKPKLTGKVGSAASSRRATHPGAKNGALSGGPQMVEISRDGKRVYFTNSLYGAIDPQFYPDGIEGWMVKLDAKPAGGIAFDQKFFVEWPAPHRPHQVRLKAATARRIPTAIREPAAECSWRRSRSRRWSNELAGSLSAQDAEQLRAFEREGHNAMAQGYSAFFAQVTALAIAPLLDAVRLAQACACWTWPRGPATSPPRRPSVGPQPIGVLDLSSGMIDLARRRHPGVEFREADVERLPFADGTFDARGLQLRTGSFPLPRAAVAECLRTLKKGGRIACAWWAEPDRQRIQGLFREAAVDVGIPPPAGLPAGHSSLRFCEPADSFGCCARPASPTWRSRSTRARIR